MALSLVCKPVHQRVRTMGELAGRAYLVGGVAALDGAGVAVATADGRRGDGEGEEREGGDTGEHGERVCG